MKFTLLSITGTILSWTTTFADPYLGQTLSLCDTPYMVSERLGKFQNLYKATNAESQEQVMLKIVNAEEHPSVLAELAVMEILKGQRHTVQLICHENLAPFVFLVMELCNGGTLHSKMRRISKLNRLPTTLEFTQLWNDMANGLLELRDKGIIQRNINPVNLFLHNGHLKIGGFNLAIQAETAPVLRASSAAYMAPEIWDQSQFNEFSDLWSAGVVFYEWSHLQHPYRIGYGDLEIRQHMNQFIRQKRK